MKTEMHRETNLASAKLAYRIKETQTVTGLSRSTIYKLLDEGKLRTVRVLGCRLILAEDIERLLKGQ